MLSIPSSDNLTSKFDLGAGQLTLPGALHGNREINIGAGKALLSLQQDQNYAHLEVNIGMGSLHDRRPGGKSAHLVVAKSYVGKGTGQLHLNVGAGSVELRPAES